MEVSGVTPPVKAAFAYWAVISQGLPPAAATALLLRHQEGPFTEVPGTLVARGPSPCWGGDRISVFRGAVPLSVATGNGLYRVELKPGANGSTNGEDPWVRSPLPLVEGASIVLVGSGSATVALYDRGLAGKTFYPDLSYALSLPASASSSSMVLFHNVGADGQSGVSTDAIPLTAAEVTSIGSGGPRIAGPGSPANDGDWNGNVADPLPQLWDNTVHEITSQVQELAIGTSLPISVQAPDDCLTPVANTVVIEASGT